MDLIVNTLVDIRPDGVLHLEISVGYLIRVRYLTDSLLIYN